MKAKTFCFFVTVWFLEADAASGRAREEEESYPPPPDG